MLTAAFEVFAVACAGVDILPAAALYDLGFMSIPLWVQRLRGCGNKWWAAWGGRGSDTEISCVASRRKLDLGCRHALPLVHVTRVMGHCSSRWGAEERQ